MQINVAVAQVIGREGRGLVVIDTDQFRIPLLFVSCGVRAASGPFYQVFDPTLSGFSGKWFVVLDLTAMFTEVLQAAQAPRLQSRFHIAGGTLDLRSEAPTRLFADSFCVLSVVSFCRQFIAVPSLGFGHVASLPGLCGSLD